MVKGLDLFRSHFASHADQYTLIGGAAASEWFRRSGLTFRATKDLDIVLFVDALDDAFLNHFWAFIRLGGYQVRERGDPDRRYHRFAKPTNPDFPNKLELSSLHRGDFEATIGQSFIPIRSGEEAESLSAILMNEHYYRIVRDFREVVDDLPMVTPAGIMLLKARAWIELFMRKEAGEQIDTRNINKHRNDIFRLSLLLPVGESFTVPSTVLHDFQRFLDAFPAQSPDWMAIREGTKITAPLPPPSELIAMLRGTFTSNDLV